MSVRASRDERRHPNSSEDFRSPAQRDRDRVLYSSGFRRLAGVTQVVGPVEGHIFHNRLTHTLEVAQIGRRIAERLVAEQRELATELGGIDPEVVEASALIHDLGHPPFGHAGEDELNALVTAQKDEDGFEGNPQSFRIVTRLAAHRTGYKGLNLTRATLAASLKYPYFRKGLRAGKPEKFGAYRSDAKDFYFARADSVGESKGVEAQIMDYADAVAYSVHDLDDFYRAGLIPLDRLLIERSDALSNFLAEWSEDPQLRGVTANEIALHQDMLRRWLNSAFIDVPPAPTWMQGAALRTVTAGQIAEFVNPVRLQVPDPTGACLQVPRERYVLLRFCQRLVWRFVIANPRLATQQHGQRKIVRTLFEVYCEAAQQGKTDLLPPRFREDLEAGGSNCPRLAADIVASFTDAQAVLLYNRLTGASTGSVAALL